VHKTDTNLAALPSGSCEIFATTYKIKLNPSKHKLNVKELENTHRAWKYRHGCSVIGPLFVFFASNLKAV
jgi:hypothetical protein